MTAWHFDIDLAPLLSGNPDQFYKLVYGRHSEPTSQFHVLSLAVDCMRRRKGGTHLAIVPSQTAGLGVAL